MMRIHVFFVIYFLAVTPFVQAVNIRLQLEGLSGDLQRNILEKLSSINIDEIIENRYVQTIIKREIKEGLCALGYYEPRIEFENLSAIKHAKKSTLIIRVTPQNPIKISSSIIVLRGDAFNDPDYQNWIKEKKPKNGAILNHGQYDTFKNGFANLALQNGYFDGKFNKSQLGVLIERCEAFLDLEYDSGKRYRFGNVIFEGSQIRDEYLRRLIPFKKNDYYSSHSLSELNRRLSATGWFNSIILVPELDKTSSIKIISFKSILSPRSENSIETGIGYTTDIGFRLKAIWHKPWTNSRGYSFSSSSYISNSEQEIDLSYKLPLLKNPLEQYYFLQSKLKRTNLNDTESDSSVIMLSRYWDSSAKWQKAIHLRWRLDHFTQANTTNTTMLVYPGISINLIRSYGGMMPIWGNSHHYSIDISNTIWRSDVDFFVFQAQNTWIRTLKSQHRFIVRSNLGWIKSSDFNKVPPDLRFFAGGDRSLRGYKYKRVSPINRNGQLIGGSKLIIGSFEHQYNIVGRWWIATFADFGEAVNNIRKNSFKIGTGIGIRFQLPIGPIKLDLARLVGSKEENGLQFYIGLGSEL